MKKLIALTLVMASAMTSLAWADVPENNGGPQPWEQQHHGDQAQGRDQHHYDPQRMHEGSRFASYGNEFRRGHPAPVRFRGAEYQVNDWRDRGLPPPPDGQHWSYIDGNYVLIAAATGVITAIILNGALNH